MDLNAQLHAIVEKEGSDIFIKGDVVSQIRINGDLHPIEMEPTTKEGLTAILQNIMPTELYNKFLETHEMDFSYQFKDICRFRCNAFYQRGEPALVLRRINNTTLTFEQLGLPPEVMTKIASERRGLVLVTGVTGSGKSTTLASMIEHINQNFPRHIVTLEDPIEYMYTEKRSMINQREIGLDSADWHSALKAVLREAPDVILIGEMRDLYTIEAAIHAAETGHLVFSTLHTINAVQTLERIINYFPAEQHKVLRMQLSMILKGAISQRLIPCTDGTRVPAVEILTDTPSVKEILLEGRTNDLPNAIRDGEYYGNQTFNQSLKGLYDAGKITYEDALEYADNPDELKLEFRGISRGTRSSDFGY